MNNKGFMMAEVIVVSAVVMVTLVGLYTSYNKIFSLYNQRLNYYDVSTLYELAFIRDNNIDSLVLNTKNNVGGDIVYYVDKNKIKNRTIDTTGLNKTFKEYLDYLSTSLDFNSMIVGDKIIKNILIMEQCDSDKSNCKYSYLEVIDKDSSLVLKCTLSVSGTTITASVNREDNISYMGFDENRINDNGVMTKIIDGVDDYIFSIEDNDGNVGTCSLSVSEYSSVSTETKNCSSFNWSNKGSACSSGYSYITNSCSRTVSSYTASYATCWYDEANQKYWWRDNSDTKSGLSVCSAVVADSTLCSYQQQGTVAISQCTETSYNYSGTITCKKYVCGVNGHTRIDNTNYCYKIN